MARPKLTEAARRMLENVRAGRPAGDGFGSGSYAGQAASIVASAMLRRDFLRLIQPPPEEGPAFELTPEGLAELER